MGHHFHFFSLRVLFSLHNLFHVFENHAHAIRATAVTMRAATLTALASSASAIMIPSTVSVPGLEISDIEATNLKSFGVDPKSQLLKVDCAGCAFAQKDSSDRLVWEQGVENALVLNVSVGEQVGTLELNGVRFYPPLMNFAVENPVPYIPQVPAEMSLVEVRKQMEKLAKNALRLTSWSFQAGPSATVSESGDEILTIHLQLDALEREPINVPSVSVTALKTVEGELSIVKVEMQDKEEAEKEECEMWPMMCKLKDMLNGSRTCDHTSVASARSASQQTARTTRRAPPSLKSTRMVIGSQALVLHHGSRATRITRAGSRVRDVHHHGSSTAGRVITAVHHTTAMAIMMITLAGSPVRVLHHGSSTAGSTAATTVITVCAMVVSTALCTSLVVLCLLCLCLSCLVSRLVWSRICWA